VAARAASKARSTAAIRREVTRVDHGMHEKPKKVKKAKKKK